jgi:uncharacterized protein (UPF0548 family)
MFLLSKPREDAVRSFVVSQKNLKFSYSNVGYSQQGSPPGFNCDHNRIQLGSGRETFERAIAAVRQWKMFQMPWVQLCWPDAPIETGAVVGVLVSHLGFWSLNACRIVYVIDERAAVERFGFAYGTLPGHAERGEERFSVEYHSDDGSVWYDLFAFSRPGPLARLAYPLARSLQKRFARDSKVAMRTAVSNGP